MIQGAQPKYVMTDTISMGGNLAGGTYNLHGTEIEVTDHTKKTSSIRLSDCAGMYMAVAVRAVSDSQISSYWSHEYKYSRSYAEFRIPRVQNGVPDMAKSRTGVVYTEAGHYEGDTAGQNDNRTEQTTLTCTVESYAEHYLLSGHPQLPKQQTGVRL